MVAHTLKLTCLMSGPSTYPPIWKLQYSSARTVYWHTQARGKRKYVMRFEIRYFFLEIGLSPSGLTQSQEKSI